jgi:hypothetical protein
MIHEPRRKIRNLADIVAVEVNVARRRTGKPEDAQKFVQQQPAVEAG